MSSPPDLRPFAAERALRKANASVRVAHGLHPVMANFLESVDDSRRAELVREAVGDVCAAKTVLLLDIDALDAVHEQLSAEHNRLTAINDETSPCVATGGDDE